MSLPSFDAPIEQHIGLALRDQCGEARGDLGRDRAVRRHSTSDLGDEHAGRVARNGLGRLGGALTDENCPTLAT